MFPGETILSGASKTCDCGHVFKFKVMQSNEFYIGTSCENDKCEYYGHPNSRESNYYKTRKEAEEALAKGPEIFGR